MNAPREVARNIDDCKTNKRYWSGIVRMDLFMSRFGKLKETIRQKKESSTTI